MKNIMLISSVVLFFAGSQICGCGSCSEANAQTLETTITKSQPKTITLKVTGMTCAGCANHISTSLEKLDGVLEHEVKFPGDIAIVKYDPDKVSEKEIIATIEKTGKYKVEVTTDAKEQGATEKKSCAPNCTKSCCTKK